MDVNKELLTNKIAFYIALTGIFLGFFIFLIIILGIIWIELILSSFPNYDLSIFPLFVVIISVIMEVILILLLKSTIKKRRKWKLENI